MTTAEKETPPESTDNIVGPPDHVLTQLPGVFTTQLAAERYDSLKINLLASRENDPFKMLMVTSCASGDGVSTTVVNLATTLAKDRNLKILIIDANLRSPRYNDLMKNRQVNSLGDLANVNPRSISHLEVWPGNLQLLPAGLTRVEPVVLFESDQFKRYLLMMRDKFNYVLVDAPPVQGSPETLALASRVDGVLMVLASGKTRQEVAARSKKQIESAGGKVIGAVLNQRKYYIPDFIYRRL
jgi:capsular exopolysaccharide synthesis family protein